MPRADLPRFFSRLYATLLDGWLRCDSKAVLGARFEPVKLLRKG